MKLSYAGLQQPEEWRSAGVRLPAYDWQKMHQETLAAPTWIHFGAGNIFRGFIARLQQSLLEQGLVKSGILAVDTFDYDIITRIYEPHDALALAVSLHADGHMEKEIVASIAAGLRAGVDFPQDMARLQEAFVSPSLQMVSFTITEKGYALAGLNGAFFADVEADFAAGPGKCTHAMSLVTQLLLQRYLAGGLPVAMVSMDNCSHNGEKLRGSVLTVAQKWWQNGFVSDAFIAWLQDETQVSFPWTMIDKITPRPAPEVERALTEAGVEEMQPLVTSRNTFIAPFVNAEVPQYLVVEDRFPAGRPPLEQAGVYMTDRATVNSTERMKVTTCLNPLHTALAVYGCLLGYTSIAAEMQDVQLKTMVEQIGYTEGMRVVVDPGILNPRSFVKEVVDQRLPNPFIPDTPQRIATDTSQKVAIRFGETIKAYAARPELEVGQLTFIPLAIAGWLRYLLGVDDAGAPMPCSSDPMLDTLQQALAGVMLGHTQLLAEKLRPILRNEVLFGANLEALGLSQKIIEMTEQLCAGPGAVRAVLKKYTKN